MKEKCSRDAKRAVQALTRRNNEDCLAVERGLLHILDGAGAYKAAVREGLHEALCGTFRNDVDHLPEILRGYTPACLTRTVTRILFRGQRAEGRTRKCDCVDGQRIKAYVKSHPEAFDVWFSASVITILLPLASDVRSSGSSLYAFAHRAAHDVIEQWSHVWANRQASRAILLPAVADGATETAAQAAKARAQSIGDRYCLILERAHVLDDGAVETMVCMCAAIVACRIREFEIDLDFSKQLKLKGLTKQSYEQMAVPVGNATVEKGAALTEAEGKEAIMAFASRR
jgi:hypothetical protein